MCCGAKALTLHNHVYIRNVCVRASCTHNQSVDVYDGIAPERTRIRIRKRIHHVKLCEKESSYCWTVLGRLRAVDGALLLHDKRLHEGGFSTLRLEFHGA